MSRRTLALLVAAVAALSVLVGIAYRGDRGQHEQPLLLPQFKSQLDDVRRITVTGPDNALIATLERGADHWTVAEHNNYPADLGRIRRNLLLLAEARIVEEKTSNPELYARLGVQELADDAAGGVLLTVSGGATGETELASVIIGQAQAGAGDFTYVRRAGEANSWQVTGRFDPGKTGAEWLDRLVIDLPAERVAAVTINEPGVGTLHLARPAPAAVDPSTGPAPGGITDFAVANIPAGRSLSYPGVGNSIAGALADLRLEDVHTREALGSDPGKPIVARFVTGSGLTVETSTWRLAEGSRVTFLASGEGEAATEAATINARIGGWVYALPAYKGELLTRRLRDLLAPA